MGSASSVCSSRRDVSIRRRCAAGELIAGVVAAFCLQLGVSPVAGAEHVGPTPPKPGHCKVAQQQLADGTTIAPPDARFDWRSWLDDKPADWPCQPGALFGGLMSDSDIPSWVLDELHRG